MGPATAEQDELQHTGFKLLGSEATWEARTVCIAQWLRLPMRQGENGTP